MGSHYAYPDDKQVRDTLVVDSLDSRPGGSLDWSNMRSQMWDIVRIAYCIHSVYG